MHARGRPRFARFDIITQTIKIVKPFCKNFSKKFVQDIQLFKNVKKIAKNATPFGEVAHTIPLYHNQNYRKQDKCCKNVKAVKYKKRKTKPFHAAVHTFKNSRRKRRRIRTREG